MSIPLPGRKKKKPKSKTDLKKLHERAKQVGAERERERKLEGLRKLTEMSEDAGGYPELDEE